MELRAGCLRNPEGPARGLCDGDADIIEQGIDPALVKHLTIFAAHTDFRRLAQRNDRSLSALGRHRIRHRAGQTLRRPLL